MGKSIQSFLGAVAISALCVPGAALADDHANAAVTQLDAAKRAELMAHYPNTSWGSENWYLNELVQLDDNLYTFANKNNTRTFVLVTEEGVVVGDPISVEDAKLLREKIRAVTDKPVTHVIYSHNHWDHIEGAQVFKDEGATIYSHDRCVKKFRDRPTDKVVMPDVTFEGDYTLEVGGERIEMRYFGENHSSCLIFPSFRDRKYLFLVDVVSPGAIPWGIVPDTDFLGSIDTLKELEKLNYEVVIPGHGAPMVSPSALEERRLYLTALYEAVADELEPDGFKPDTFYENVTARMEPWSYMRAFSFQFRQNLETMLYYVGIGE